MISMGSGIPRKPQTGRNTLSGTRLSFQMCSSASPAGAVTRSFHLPVAITRRPQYFREVTAIKERTWAWGSITAVQTEGFKSVSAEMQRYKAIYCRLPTSIWFTPHSLPMLPTCTALAVPSTGRTTPLPILWGLPPRPIRWRQRA